MAFRHLRAGTDDAPVQRDQPVTKDIASRVDRHRREGITAEEARRRDDDRRCAMTIIITRSPGTGRTAHRRSVSSKIRGYVGGFYLFTAGVHLGIVAADPQFYRPFADPSYLPFIRDAWHSVFMAHPASWGLALMAGEILPAVLFLVGGRAAPGGWVGVIVFHVLLMLFGFGI